MSLMDDAFEWLNAELKTHESREVTYWAMGESVTIAQATMGQTRTENDNGDGAIVEGRVVDWLIDVDDILIDGETVKPEIGHSIIDSSGDRIVEYQVTDLGNEPCCRYMDRRNKKWRIHTTIRKIS